MPSKLVEVPGLGKVEFPDSMSDQDISAAIQKQTNGGSEKSLGGFLSNVGTSAANFVGDAAHAVTHPGDTLRAIGSIPVGLAEKAGVPMPAPGPGETDAAKQLDAMLDHFKGRYGSFDKAKEALYQDPVGVLSDVSVLAGGAGAAADAAKLGKVAKVASTVSELTDPLRMAGKAVSATGVPAKAAEAAKDALTRTALRPGFTVNTDAGKVANAVDAMKEGNTPFSEVGLDKVSKAIKRIQLEKDAETTGAASSGVTIDPANVETRLDQVMNRRQLQVNPDADLKQIEKVRQNFRNRTGNQPIPADEADALKSGTYANNNYEPQEHVAATSDAEKALARGLKEELEAKIPELTGLNADQAKQIDLEGILSGAVTKYRNEGGFLGNLQKNLLGGRDNIMRTAAIVAGGGYLSHNPLAGAAAAVMHAVLSDPQVKIALVRGINMAQRSNPAKWATPVNALRTINAYSDSFGKFQGEGK